jgi:hypothetical protein
MLTPNTTESIVVSSVVNYQRVLDALSLIDTFHLSLIT